MGLRGGLALGVPDHRDVQHHADAADDWAMEYGRTSPKRGRNATLAAAAGAATLVLALVTASVSAAAPYPSKPSDAKVMRVDGPGLLTLKRGGRTFAVRLIAIDAPRAASAEAPAECGATEAADALSRMTRGRRVAVEVARAPGDESESVPAPSSGGPVVRDLSGRLMVSLVVLGKRRRGGSNLTLSSRLVRSGWARYGLPTNGTDLPVRGDLSALSAVSIVEEPWSEAKQGAGPDDDGSLTNRGLWKLCGGRFHLPSGVPPPAFTPAPWAVSANGILSAIGDHPITPSIGDETSLGAFMTAFPAGELVTYAFGCALWLPERGFTVTAFNFAILSDRPPKTMDCRAMSVVSVSTTGRGVPALAGAAHGASTGDPVDAFKRVFPQASIESEDSNSSTSEDVLFLGPSAVLDAKADSSSRPIGVVIGALDARRRAVMRLNANIFDPFSA